MLYWLFIHFSQSIFRKIQSLRLAKQYMEDPEFAMYMRLLPILAFVTENIVLCDCFTLLIGEFHQAAIEVANYFKQISFVKKLPDQTRRLSHESLEYACTRIESNS